MAREFARLVNGRRAFDRDAFEEAFAHVDLVERKTQLRREIERFNTRPPIPAALRTAVFARDGYSCLECGCSERLSLDHIQPYSRGGADTLENLRTLCLSCNCRKGDSV